MVKALSLFALAGVASAETVKLSYTDCGSSSTHGKITGLTPDTIEVPGKSSVVGSGSLDSDQTSASFSLKVKKAGIPLVSGKGSICEDTTIKIPLGAGSFTVKGIDCPKKAGDVAVQVDLDILSDLFDGANNLLSIHIEANADDTGDQVLCLDIDASQGSDFEVGDHGKVFMAGFLEGFVGEAEHIKACVGESMKAVEDAQHLVADLKSKNFNKTVADVQALVTDVMADLSACKEVPKDLKPFLDAFKGVHGLKDLVKKIEDNFLAHDKEILDLLEDMLEVCTFGSPDAHKCGEDAGKQVRSLVIGDKSFSVELEDHGKVFMAGFLEGFLGDSEHIKACISDSMKVAGDLGNLVGDLKSRNFNKTIADVEALVTDAMDDVKVCKDMGKDLASLMAAFKGVHNIKDLMNKLKENFLAHDKQVLDLLEDMVETCTFKSPDAHKCGEDAGKQVRAILVGDTVLV